MKKWWKDENNRERKMMIKIDVNENNRMNHEREQ